MYLMDRRRFLTTTALAGAATTLPKHAGAADTRTKVATLDELNPVKLAYYPDSDSPIFVMALVGAVDGGVGPRSNVVAFSALCTHRGCPVTYRRDRLICPCHFSAFDPAVNGQCYQGPASESLPRVLLEVDGDNVFAVGVDGLIWGRRRSQ